MKCVQCGHEFTEGIFCPECGHKYDVDEVARIEKEKAELEKQEAERKAREQAEVQKARQEQEELAARTYNGKVYADKEEAELAKTEADKVEGLKQRMLSTKKQDERRKMVAEFGTPPVTMESRQRYDALKSKAEQQKPKSIIINWIYGLTVLIAFILVAVLNVENGAVYYVAMAWAGCGIYIWIIWKIVLFIKSKGEKYYLNIKHL
jgi:predicted  nucleic acid-binding Zn-ribbon protein